MTFLHIGKSVPKQLQKEGWKEAVPAMHIGHGTWIFSLERNGEMPEIVEEEKFTGETLTGFCNRLGISFQHYQRRISDKGCPKFEIETCRDSKRPRFIFATPELEAWLTRHKKIRI